MFSPISFFINILNKKIHINSFNDPNFIKDHTLKNISTFAKNYKL